MMVPQLMQLLYLCLTAAAATTAEEPAAQATKAAEEGVLVVRHSGAVQPRAAVATKPVPDTGPTATELRVLARLAEAGLIRIRPIQIDRINVWSNDAPWNYTPKEYHGYHPKPDFSRHSRPGWRYDAQTGWRHRPEPTWSHQPGAMAALLRQLPTSGQGWYVTRWR